ncbi:CPBP family intramembrane glutamic endopeptidase [Flammeovirgaceae bacterium SG7u.111]|nr:CPBP family intramembrane glutamic endopeptidase [Flammeovirgaceae bacterium SG7u.132]WPO38556.1 CPBP family intramembrane glutamic endopeptidase [Flammeovirgaceae bacterium SG7u.111]
MKKIISSLKKHHSEFYEPRFLLAWLVLLGGLIFWKYSTGTNVRFWGLEYRYLWGFLLYAVPFYTAAGLYYLFKKPQENFFKKKGFWIDSLLILTVLFVLRYCLSLYRPELIRTFAPTIPAFFGKLIFSSNSVFLYFLLPISYWLVIDKKKYPDNFYGLTRKGFDAKPYIFLLLISLPFLAGASFSAGFQKVYPFYKPADVPILASQTNYWSSVLIFELFYICQFVCLELFFRGFIVMRLQKYMGGASVWLMVTLYCILHFGKPMPETLASIVGGYVLGVIAYYSRSVFGGIIVHVGVAVCMDIFAHLQLLSK